MAEFQTPDDEALQTGGAFQTPDSEAVAPDEGAMMAAGRGALRNFPMAQQVVAGVEPGNYQQNLQDLTSKAEAAKAAHGIAYRAGALAAGALPAAIPGVGEAMAASLPASVAGGATIGALQSLSDTPLNKAPENIAKTAAEGAIPGAAGGALGNWIGKLLPTPEEADTGALLQKLNLPSRGGAATLGNNIVEGAEDLAGTMRTRTPSGQSLNEWSDFALRNAKKINQAIDEYGDQIGQITNGVDAQIPAKPLLRDIQALKMGEGGWKAGNTYIDQIVSEIKDNAEGGNLSFSQLRGLTNRIYKNMVVEDPQTGKLLPESDKALEAWKYLRSLQDAIIQKQDPESWGAFHEAMGHYSNLVGLQKALNRVAVAAEKKQTNLGGWLNPIGLFSKSANALGSATGVNRIANNLPFKLMPTVNAVRGALPAGIPQAELADYLTQKFGKKIQ